MSETIDVSVVTKEDIFKGNAHNDIPEPSLQHREGKDRLNGENSPLVQQDQVPLDLSAREEVRKQNQLLIIKVFIRVLH